MKTLFILALLAFTAISASATTNVGYHQGLEWQQQPLFSQQYPFPIYWQQSIPLQYQNPFQQQQQQFPQQWLQPFPQQQQQFHQQSRFIQPFLQQQLNPCKELILQQCSPLSVVPFLRSQVMQQSSCQVIRQQCCRQLAQIPEQFRYQAIQNVVHTIIMQQQQQGQAFFQPKQQLGQGLFFPPQVQQQLGLGMFFPPQVQQQLGQGFFYPQQLAHFQALQTPSATCNANVPQFGNIYGGIGGY